jgi:hypothetical protein
MLAYNLPTFTNFSDAISHLLEKQNKEEDYFIGLGGEINDFLISQFDDEDLERVKSKYIFVKRSDLITLPIDIEKAYKIMVVKPTNQIHILQCSEDSVWGFPINSLITDLYPQLNKGPLAAYQSDLMQTKYI